MYQHRVSVTGTDSKTRPILRKVLNTDPMFLTVREDHWIKKMNSKASYNEQAPKGHGSDFFKDCP